MHLPEKINRALEKLGITNFELFSSRKSDWKELLFSPGMTTLYLLLFVIGMICLQFTGIIAAKIGEIFGTTTEIFAFFLIALGVIALAIIEYKHRILLNIRMIVTSRPMVSTF